jgi:hypothetical protein
MTNLYHDSEKSLSFTVAWGKLYKTVLFNDIRFPANKFHEDEFVCHRILYKCKKVVYTNEKLIYYLQRKESIMGSGFSLNKTNDAIQAFEERISFFKLISRFDLIPETNRRIFSQYIKILKKIEILDEVDGKKHFLKFLRFYRVLFTNQNKLKYFLYYNFMYLKFILIISFKIFFKQLKLP